MRRAQDGRGVTTVVGLATAVVALLAWAAAAFACTNLATISLSSGFGKIGDSVILTGTSFPIPRVDSATAPTPVVLHWGASDGPVLATLTPDRTGTVSTTFKVPPSAPGNVVIVALQRRSVIDPNHPDAPPTSFIDEAGTPARATFRVLASDELPPTTNPSSQAVANSSDDGSTAIVVLMVVFGAVATSLFAGGVIAFLHQVRSRPAAEPWRHN